MSRARGIFYVTVGGVSVLATALVFGCGSSSASSVSADAGDGGESAETDDADTPGDATHKDEQPAVAATYACAVQGGFGWHCTVAGPDSAECTDPRFPYCFVGAQGGRCTAPCGDAGVAACPSVGADAGCVPTDCNARGYCK